jgi:hypothetical protein
MKVRVEYESTPIRHIAVQCDRCFKWFAGREITANESDKLDYDFDIFNIQFICPVCGHTFGANACENYKNLDIEECGNSTEVYKDCLKETVKWE